MKYGTQSTLDEKVSHINTYFQPSESYIAYGMGQCFRFLKSFLDGLLNISFCVDKKAVAGEFQAEGYAVLPPEALLTHLDEKIIIAANGEYYSEIKSELLEMGFEEKQLVSGAELITVWGAQYKKQTAASYVSFPILSGCTLNCAGCIHYTNYHKKRFYLTREEVLESIDTYFKCVDVVDEIQIFGGEPFLHKEIGEICLYLSRQYGERYQRALVTTNGTVIPSDQNMALMKQCKKLFVSISDYSQTNDEKLKIDRLVEKCREAGVEYILNSNFYQSDVENLWFDCGDPNVKKDDACGETASKFANCTLVGPGVYKSKYYYCPNSMFADITGILTGGTDWLDLHELLSMSGEERGRSLQAWHLGLMAGEKLDFCSYCAGFGKKVNQRFIQAGKQITYSGAGGRDK